MNCNEFESIISRKASANGQLKSQNRSDFVYLLVSFICVWPNSKIYDENDLNSVEANAKQKFSAQVFLKIKLISLLSTFIWMEIYFTG